MPTAEDRALEGDFSVRLHWHKCEKDTWCRLNALNLDHPLFNGMEGVYMIWHGGERPSAVRIGQGVIRERLRAHRDDPEIQAFKSLTLYVTWASVPETYRDGIETFLAQKLQPKMGARYPAARLIEVNLPF
jgi:hypothetical protein